MAEPDNEQIVEALRKSGFLFEQEVAIRLEGAGYSVRTAASYRDPDSDTPREIDIIATRGLGDRSEPTQEEVLVIECKSSPQPHVVFTRPWTSLERSHQPNEVYLVDADDGLGVATDVWKERSLDGEWVMNRLDSIPKGVQVVRIERNKDSFAARNVIHEVGLPAIKAGYDFGRKFQGQRYFMYPACVTAGALYALDPTSVQNVSLSEASYAAVQYENSADWSGPFHSDYFDLVPFSSIDSWLSLVQNTTGRLLMRLPPR